MICLEQQQTENNKNLISIERYGTPGKAIDVGDEAATWFRQVFKIGIAENIDLSENERESYNNHTLSEVRLCRVSKLRRPIDKTSHQGSGATDTDSVRFQAFGGIHIMSKEAITWLQRNLPPNTYEADVAHSKRPMIINAERFRANIVVSGVKFPEEDQWKRIDVVSVSKNESPAASCLSFHFAKHTDRCDVPTMDLLSGKRHPTLQPTNTIKKLRGAKHPWQITRHERFQKHPEEFKEEVKFPTVKGMLGIEMFQDRSSASSDSVFISVGDEIIIKEKFEKGLEFIAQE